MRALLASALLLAACEQTAWVGSWRSDEAQAARGGAAGAGGVGDGAASGSGAGGNSGAPQAGAAGGSSLPACELRVIGHRGDSFEHPENTLVSFEHAFQQGAALVEVDVRLTRDRVPYTMIDSTLDRTTDRSGASSSVDAAELPSIDAGSWKDARFSAQHPPTTAQVLALAKRYGRGVYLDPKEWVGPELRAVIDASGLDRRSILIGVYSSDDLARWAAAIPDVGLVYWGGVPTDWGKPTFDGDAFMAALVANGAVAVEVPWAPAADPQLDDFVQAAHAHGLQAWTYWVNDYGEMQRALTQFDRVETDVTAALHHAACGAFATNTGDAAVRTDARFDGSWSAAIGQLQLNGATATFDTASALGVPALDSRRYLSLPALPSSAAVVATPPPASGARWSIVMDLVRTGAPTGYTALVQTDPTNTADAEVYIRADGGIGIDGNYTGRVPNGAWSRLAFVVDTDGTTVTLRKFLNGVAVGTQSVDASRFTLAPTAPLSLFTDDNSETTPLVVGAIQVRATALREAEVLTFGAPNGAGIPRFTLPPPSP